MNKRLFVAGLPFSSTDSDLKDHFSKAVVITLVQIIIDKFSGRSKGFGFIEFEKEEEAAKAIEMFHETDFGGRKLIVAEAKPMEKREFKPRSGGGDDRRGGYSDDRRPSFGGRPKFTRGGGRTGGFRNDR